MAACWTVEGAERVARRLVSGSLVGLTVVAFGTSSPEFAVTLMATFEGRGSISIGNVVGSNIFNLGFILGGIALINPLQTNPLIVWRDGSVLAVATFALLFMRTGWRLSRKEGLLLISLASARWILDPASRA